MDEALARSTAHGVTGLGSSAARRHMRRTPVYSMPQGTPLRLELAPRLESWNAKDHPDQVRLREFVTHLGVVIGSTADTIDAPLALRLDVGLDRGIDPLWQRDLDNYLFPIARALPERYVSIWGTKGRAPASFVTVGPAVPVAPPTWQRAEAKMHRPRSRQRDTGSSTQITDPANRGKCDERCAGCALSSADTGVRGDKSTGAPGGAGCLLFRAA